MGKKEIKEVIDDEKRKEHAIQRRATQQSGILNKESTESPIVEIKTQPAETEAIRGLNNAVDQASQKLYDEIIPKTEFPLLSKSYKEKTKYTLCYKCLSIFILDYPFICKCMQPECPECGHIMQIHTHRGAMLDKHEFLKSRRGRGV